MGRTLRKASQLRYEQGDITLLERNMSSTLVADLQTRLSQAEEELQLATRRFSWTCYSDSPLLPMDTTLVLFPARVAEIAPSDIHLNYFRSVADEKKAMLRIERSPFLPGTIGRICASENSPVERPGLLDGRDLVPGIVLPAA